MILKTTLLDHQRDAVNKLLPLRVGALFMEMGTGKSRTAIELVARRTHKISKVIWFCPVSLKETVRQEIMKHVECTQTDVYVFDDRTNMRNVPSVFWYVVGIESMSASNRVILTVNYIVDELTFAIVDESQYIKGHYAARTNWITNICARARYRLILTGTPISQGIVDLYAQMRFLSLKILGYASFYSFAHNHLEYSDKYPGLIVRSHNTDYIASKIQPYVYQVTKEECLTLPDKLYISRYFTMTSEQQEYYLRAKDELLLSLTEDQIDSVTIFRLFTALQQITSGFWNRNGKLIEMLCLRVSTLHSVLHQDIPDTAKVIIWAKYKYDVDRIHRLLMSNYGVDTVYLFHGGVPQKDRQRAVQRFLHDDQVRFFVATPSSGGHGLTLNVAHYVVFYNNGFKYSERLQAEDRCHRIGQDKKVVYIDIVCAGTIDERIQEALSNKEDVVAAFKREVDKVKRTKDKGKLTDSVEAL